MSPVKMNEFIPCTRKIADITESDTNPHTITMDEMGLPANTVLLIINTPRSGGVGNLNIYPASGTRTIFGQPGEYKTPNNISIINGELKYALSDADDSFEIICFGYLIQIVRG